MMVHAAGGQSYKCATLTWGEKQQQRYKPASVLLCDTLLCGAWYRCVVASVCGWAMRSFQNTFSTIFFD